MKSIFSLLFPSLEVMQIGYPILKKSPFLLPFFFIIRGLKIVLFRRDRLYQINSTLKIDRDELNKRKEFHNKAGLR